MFPNFSGRVRWGAVARTLTPTGARQLIGCCHFLAGRHPAGMTKTRRANPFKFKNKGISKPRKRPPCFLILADVSAGGAVARTLTPTGARQLIGCCHFLAGRHPAGTTKTRRANPFNINLGQSTILGNDRLVS